MDLTPPAPPIHNLYWWALTDKGRVRANNEDSFLGLQFDAQEVNYLGKIGEASTGQKDFLFAVSDGMGGANAGEFASRIAVDKITRLMPASFKQSASGLGGAFEDILTELYHRIHQTMTYFAAGDPDCAGMGATLTLCWFAPGWMYFGHIGDSRLYYIPAKGGEIKQLSQDDTHVGWLYRNGKLSEWEFRNHPGRHGLQKALGAGHQFVDPQVGAVGYEPGDMFLLCTDGVTDGLYESTMLDLLRPPKTMTSSLNPAERIVQTALQQSGRDNTTAIIIEVR